MARPRKFNQDEALNKAMRVFWRQGYEATSMSDLTNSMGMKPQSIYNAFGDKHSLYLKALEHYRAKRKQGMFESLTRHATVREGFSKLFTCIIDEATDDPECKGCMVVNAMTELAGTDPTVKTLVDTAEAENQAAFASAIRLGQQRDEMPKHKNPEALAAFLYNAVIGLRVRARKNADRDMLKQIVEVTLASLN